MDDYEEFISIVKRIHLLEYVDHLLGWDKEVIMAEGGERVRAEQTGVLAGVCHDLATSKRLGELLSILEKEELDADQRSNVREVRREYERATRVPCELVEKIARTTSKAHNIWVEARKKKDFSLFAPTLKKILALKKEYASIVDPSRKPYENLLHEYEPWFAPSEIDIIFDKIKEKLVPLIKAINDTSNTDFLNEMIDKKVQFTFNKDMAKIMGFDFTNGRLDVSVHPFTCHPADVRITTRFSDGWWYALASTFHETGHGMYEQNLPTAHTATPRGMDAWMAVHESQSRLWENQIGLSQSFWQEHFPELKEKYGLSVDFDTFYRAINKVEPGFIRVNADELTYPLHIILRYEIERDLFEGTIDVDDLPRVWNEKIHEYLGITPPNDAEGVLQDVHWSCGLFGYFPTYLLGNMLSSQFFEKAATEDLQELGAWLKKNIHEYGRKYGTHELVERATGNQPRPDEYLKYLEEKYTKLYDLQ